MGKYEQTVTYAHYTKDNILWHVVNAYIPTVKKEALRESTSQVVLNVIRLIFKNFKRPNILLGGDFNQATELESALENLGLFSPFDLQATHYQGGQLDKIYTNGDVAACYIDNAKGMNSAKDHSILIATINPKYADGIEGKGLKFRENISQREIRDRCETLPYLSALVDPKNQWPHRSMREIMGSEQFRKDVEFDDIEQDLVQGYQHQSK